MGCWARLRGRLGRTVEGTGRTRKKERKRAEVSWAELLGRLG